MVDRNMCVWLNGSQNDSLDSAEVRYHRRERERTRTHIIKCIYAVEKLVAGVTVAAAHHFTVFILFSLGRSRPTDHPGSMFNLFQCVSAFFVLLNFVFVIFFLSLSSHSHSVPYQLWWMKWKFK